MNETDKLKRKARIGMILCIVGCLLGASGGISDSTFTLILALLGLVLALIGFSIVMPSTKKLKAMQESENQDENN